MAPGVPVPPRRVFGVHLEAGPDAGDRTWVCRAYPGAQGIRVESVDRLVDLPGGGSAPSPACAALVSKVLDAPRSAWGFDFAFGVPRELADEIHDRDAAATETAWRRVAGYLGGGSGSDAAVEQWRGAQAERARRRTDRKQDQGPLDPERFEASVLGLSRILLPLRGRPGIVMLPLDPLPVAVTGMPDAMRARLPSTYVLEVGPHRVLDRVRPGRDPTRALAGASMVRPMSRNLRRKCEDSEGALLAVAGAVAVWRGYRGEDHHLLHADLDYRFEGFTYF